MEYMALAFGIVGILATVISLGAMIGVFIAEDLFEILSRVLEQVSYKIKQKLYIRQFHETKRMTSEEFKHRMLLCSPFIGERKLSQREADQLMCRALRNLGYGDGVDIFEKHSTYKP